MGSTRLIHSMTGSSATKCLPPRQLVYGWILTVLLILSTYWMESIPPKFTEFFEGDLALSYSLHDTVP